MLHWQQKNGSRDNFLWRVMYGISIGLHLVGAVCGIWYAHRVQQHTFSVHHYRDLQSARVVLHSVPPSAAGIQHSVNTTMHDRRAILPATHVVTDQQMPKKSVSKVSKKKTRTPVKTPVQKKQPKAKKDAIAPKDQKKLRNLQPDQVLRKKPLAVIEKPVDAAHSSGDTNMVQQLPIEPLAISYADAQQVQRYEQIDAALKKHWMPPPGISDDAACTLCIMLDRSGAVQTIDIQRGSGILMFDIAARTAALAVQWPAWMWGASITITFKP